MKTTNWLKNLSVSGRFLIMVFLLFGSSAGYAKIPEPANVIYGIPPAGVSLVSLEINGQEIVAYTMGADPKAGNYYILIVPIDALDPQEPGTARPGDVASIYLDNAPQPAKTVIIGSRGTFKKIHLDNSDIDGDGLTDAEERDIGTNINNPDTDGDGLTDFDEGTLGTNPLLIDSDGDGYSDGQESEAGTDPDNQSNLPVVYVNMDNTSGTEDGSEQNPYNTIIEGIEAAPQKYTVIVAPGIYQENIVIETSVSLVGSGPDLTIIDGGNFGDVIYLDPASAVEIKLKGFTIRNAENGIFCGDNTSLSIRNNIFTEISDTAIFLGSFCNAKVVNNTITGNKTGTGINTASSDVSIINNILYDNDIGIACTEDAQPRIDYNDVWQSRTADYDVCFFGEHDVAIPPDFAETGWHDYHLSIESGCIDNGDPVESLIVDYTGGSVFNLNDTTNVEAGDRLWISDGIHSETTTVQTVGASFVSITWELMNQYPAGSSLLFTEFSDPSNEPPPGDLRIDMGAYGNTASAGGKTPVLAGDTDGDGDVDGTDLAALQEDFGRSNCSGDCQVNIDADTDVYISDLSLFADKFGMTVYVNDVQIYIDPNVAPQFNLALNTGGIYPNADESDLGWGGGARPWDLVDGMRSYPSWNYGLATSWTLSGWYQATINFGGPVTFDTVVPWWHGYPPYAPRIAKVQVWDDASWVDVFSTTNAFDYFIINSDPSIDPNLSAGSSATEFNFNPVTASKVRVTWDQEEIYIRSGYHAWLYSFEVYSHCCPTNN